MITIVIYATDGTYLDKTVDEILDTTTDVSEIMVCDSVGLNYRRSDVKSVDTFGLGRAQAWNHAALQANGDVLVFLKDKTKLSDGWIEPLLSLLKSDYKCVCSPIIYTLDLAAWSAEPSRWRRFGWRWDLNLYDRQYVGSDDSPSISSNCVVVTKQWFNEIGGFDDGMVAGSGEDIDFSIKTWLLGGSVKMCDGSAISAALEFDYNERTVDNLARIVETWMPSYATHFYASRGIKQDQLTFAKIRDFSSRQERPIEWFLAKLQPELLNVYGLRGSAAGKSVAIVYPGASLDFINQAVVQRHDFVIGIDYAGLMYQCDFVLSDSVVVLSELQKSYGQRSLLIPLLLHDRSGGYVAAGEAFPEAQHLELAVGNSIPVVSEPPFCNFGHLGLTAVHLALFLNPASITVYGVDNKLVNGQSHASRQKFYDDGKILEDSEALRRRFAVYEYGFDCLGRLASSLNIPVLRMNHI